MCTELLAGKPQIYENSIMAPEFRLYLVNILELVGYTKPLLQQGLQRRLLWREAGCRPLSALLSVGGSHFPSHALLELQTPDGVVSGRRYGGSPNCAASVHRAESSWPGSQPPLLDWLFPPRESAEAPPWQGGGWVEDRRGMGEKPRGRKKKGGGGEELEAEGTADCAEPMRAPGRGGTKFPSANDQPEFTKASLASPPSAWLGMGQCGVGVCSIPIPGHR